MSTFDAAILGLLQGLTEFLPVSSSGHLVLFGHWLGVEQAASSVLFDVLLHLATLAAVLVVYAKDAWRATLAGFDALKALPSQGRAAFGIGQDESTFDQPMIDARLALFVVVATIPTGIIGVVFKDPLEALFHAPKTAAWALIATALILFSTLLTQKRLGKTGPDDNAKLRYSPGLWDALIIGTLQGVAIIPGISRSGTTISSALWRRIDGEAAARASFLMSVPAIIGAVILELRHVGHVQISWMAVGVGSLVAFVSGIAAILLIVRILRWSGFWFFGFYCLALAVLGLLTI